MFLSFMPVVIFYLVFSPRTGDFFQEKASLQEETKAKIHHEIVVTATRLETEEFKIGNTVTIISAEDLRKRGLTTVAQAVAQITQGFLTQNGGLGSAASIMLRGANSEHTLVLIDGLEINDPIAPSRSCDLSHLILTDVERIEILEGPQSPLYGSDAMGGIVNIILKKERKKRLTLTGEAGSFNTAGFSLSASGQIRQLSYSLAGTRLSTKGISAASSLYPGNKEKDGHANSNFSSRLSLSLKPQTEIGLLFRYCHTRTDIDNFGGPYGDDPNNHQHYQNAFLKIDFHSFHLNRLWEQKVYLAFMANKRQNRNDEDVLHPQEKEQGKFQSNFFKLDWQNNFYWKKSNTITLGFEVEREEGESTYFWSSAWGEDRSTFPRKKAISTAIYCQDHFSLGSSLFTTAGLRLDYHSRSGLAFTYRLAQAFWFERTATRIRTSLGTGFKAPSLYQLYAPKTLWGPIGNLALKPEKSFSWDIGLEQDFFNRHLGISAAFFLSRFRDLVQFDYYQGYLNIGRASSSGFRIEGKVNLLPHIMTRFILNTLEAIDSTSKEPLLRRPKFQGKMEIELSPYSSWKLLTSIIRVGPRDDLDYSFWPAERVTLDPYTLINLNLVYQPESTYSFYLRLENLTNRHYESIKGYGTPGFSFYAGFAWSL